MKKHWKLILAIFLILLVGSLVAARLYLPTYVLKYLNTELSQLNGYEGSVEDVDIHLYRGAYTIHKLVIRKKNGAIPVPFVDIASLDLSVEWRSLLHGRVVAEADVIEPVINFAVNKSGTVSQTGTEEDWSEKIKKLAPIDFNRVNIHRGKLAYKNFSTTPQVDIFVNDIEAVVTNLRNIEDKNAPLPSTIVADGTSLGKGKFHLDGRMNILKNIPDMDIKAKLEHVNLPAFNNYFRAFAGIDVDKGSFDGYTELVVKNGQVSGYVKPIARNISLINLKEDANPIKFVWESLASVVIEIFTNHRRDQFATKIQLEGNLDDIKTNTWQTIGGIIRNAFVKAFDKGFDRDKGSEE